MPNEDSIDVKTGLFGLKLAGPNAMLLFIVILILGTGLLYLWQNVLREREHHEIMCMMKLTLFIQTIPKGSVVEWERMPVDLFPCVPAFLYRQERQIR